MDDLTHFDSDGGSQMVDVGEKEVTDRSARAEAMIRMQEATLRRILDRDLAKGDVLEVARLAGIMAAKKTSSLIPLCHPLELTSTKLVLEAVDETRLRIESRVAVTARTGVEMEALTAVSIAALTVYDMCKAIDRAITIESIRLLEKKGGRSGHFVREQD